jgi:hypothetical protein
VVVAPGRALIRLGVIVVLTLVHAAGGLAGVQDSRFHITSDGAQVEFDVRDAPRRAVMERLFAGRPIDVQWTSASFADEPVTGRFTGAPSAVARQLLADADFMAVYDGGGDHARIVRLVIAGRAPTRNAHALTALDAALRAHDAARPSPLITPPPGAAAVPIVVPPADRMAAPPLVPVPDVATLVPPSPEERALPLITPRPPTPRQ